MSESAVVMGVDVGGTFTDVVLFFSASSGGKLLWTKVPSTPTAPAQAVVNGVSKALSQAHIHPTSVSQFLHGTTVGTNAVLEKKGAKTAVLMTEGFEDTLETGRQHRSELYNIFLESETPTFIAPRDQRFGVRERVGEDGSILVPLGDEEVLKIAHRLDQEKFESVAICYLFSFHNSEHELRSKQLLHQIREDLAVSLSHEVNPVMREYERLCVTAFDAYIRPVMASYLKELAGALHGMEVTRREIQTMQSRGGLASVEGALQKPVSTLLSGPAAGVIGARFVANCAGVPDVVTLDIGGTSAEIAVVTNNKPLTSTTGKFGRYPLNLPLVDVETIGAGGGSIAWLDEAGGLRVGPESAGADPGPACYGLGGQEATLTDASLVLGYINPEYFAAGERELDPGAALHAIESLASRLRLTALKTALGIHTIANAKMADAIRLASVKRGYDLRRFALLAFGGAGPVNAGPLAEDLEIAQYIIPRSPGVLSALGLLVSDVEYDTAETYRRRLDTIDTDELNRLYAKLEGRGMRQMSRDGYLPSECLVSYAADMRFVGQSSELEVAIVVPVGAAALAEIRQTFEEEHDRVYGYTSPDQAIEFVNLRTVHRRKSDRPIAEALQAIDTASSTEQSADAQPKSFRTCTFKDGKLHTPVFARDELGTGFTVSGPAVIEQEDTTTVIYPGHTALADEFGNLVVDTVP